MKLVKKLAHICARTRITVNQLIKDEEEFIKNQALTCATMPNIQIHLESTFLNCTFGYEPIRCVCDHILDEKYGPDRYQMHELFWKGDTIQSYGGLFVVDPFNEIVGIEAIHSQTSLFRQYELTYGVNQLKFVDGTYNLNRHKSTFCMCFLFPRKIFFLS